MSFCGTIHRVSAQQNFILKLLSSLINIINQFAVRQTTKGKKEKDKENYQQPIKENVFIQIVHNKKHILSSFSKALAQYQRVKLQLKVYPK